MRSRTHYIRKATQSDLDEIKILADDHKHELGFVLRPALVESIDREEVLLAVNENDIIGFVEYRHRRDDQTTLYHIVVAPTWQRLGVGRMLIDTLSTEAAERGSHHIQLKCPEDLAANAFYRRQGFELVARENGRRRELNVWRLVLPSLPIQPAIEAE